MTVKKIDLINRAYSKLRISGITVSPSNNDVVLSLNRLDDFIAALPWDVGYLYPANFGDSDPNDDSGINREAVNPITDLLANSIAGDFGKEYDYKKVVDAESALARIYVSIEGSKYPDTLPVGIANEYPNTVNSYFYRGSLPKGNRSNGNETQTIKVDDVDYYSIDFSNYINEIDDDSISTYSVSNTTGLSVLQDSESDNVITLEVKGLIVSQSSISVTVTTALGRVSTETINFNVTHKEG